MESSRGPAAGRAALIDWFERSTKQHPFIEGAAATNLAAEGQVPGAFGRQPGGWGRGSDFGRYVNFPRLSLLQPYLLTSRFELVSRFLEGIREPFLVDTAPLRARLVDAFRGERVPNRGVRLALNTVDANTGQVVRYVTAPVLPSPEYVVVDAITVDMVLASASIPLLFPPVQIGPHLLWDGGLLVNTPLAPVVALGADEVVTVLVTAPAEPNPAPFAHFGRAVERIVDTFLENAYNIDRKLLLERNRVTHRHEGRYRDVVLYEAVRPLRDVCFNAGSYLYFERRILSVMYEAGLRAASDWHARGPLVDHLDEPAVSLAAPVD